MPAVSDLLDTIKDLALVGAGDTSDDTRVLRYFNLVYKDIHRKTAQMAPTLLLAQETVTITSGVGTMTATPFSVEFVKDSGNSNQVLDVTTLVELEDKYPALDDTGNPSWYYFTSATGIATYPTNSTTVKVRYVPVAATLASTDAESAIKIPPQFHDALVWGTLVYMAYDERDKVTGPETQIAQAKYDIAMGDYQQWLLSGQPRPTVRTKAILG